MSSMSIMSFVYLAIGLLIPLLFGVCGLVCVVYRRLSAWLALVALGFFGETVLGIADRVFNLLLFRMSDMPSHSVMQRYHLGLTLGYVLAVALMTLGIILALGDISRRMARLRDVPGEVRDRMPAQEAREAWRPRQEGSRDIQE